MTLDEFSEITRAGIKKHNFEELLPAVFFPARHKIMVLTGMPSDEDPEKLVLEWAVQLAQNKEEFLVSFKVDVSHFKVIRCVGPFSESEIYAVV